MTGHRQAAVALHALADTDRALVLAELPDNDQQILRGYLAELDELGFEASETAEAASTLPRAADVFADVPADALADARAVDLHRVLEGEPASLVAQLLSIQPWQWRADYLALQTVTRREQLRNAAPDTAVAPMRAAFLVDGLRARLERLPAASAAASRDNGKRRPAWLRLVNISWTR
jgi:hypothetical protein